MMTDKLKAQIRLMIARRRPAFLKEVKAKIVEELRKEKRHDNSN